MLQISVDSLIEMIYSSCESFEYESIYKQKIVEMKLQQHNKLINDTS